jgi:hypothetical protein
VTTPPPIRPRRSRHLPTSLFRSLVWSRTPHLIADVPIGFAGLTYALFALLALGFAAVGVGIPVLAWTVLGARRWGAAERSRARRLPGLRVTEPAPFRYRSSCGSAPSSPTSASRPKTPDPAWAAPAVDNVRRRTDVTSAMAPRRCPPKCR